MNSEDRKAAREAYKERKAIPGIYAVRCAATGEAWVGRALDIDKVQNRLWFSLGTGNDPHRSLQAAWSAHGPDGLVFEAVERLDPDETAYVRDAMLRDRLGHWRERLAATIL